MIKDKKYIFISCSYDNYFKKLKDNDTILSYGYCNSKLVSTGKYNDDNDTLKVGDIVLGGWSRTHSVLCNIVDIEYSYNEDETVRFKTYKLKLKEN